MNSFNELKNSDAIDEQSAEFRLRYKNIRSYGGYIQQMNNFLNLTLSLSMESFSLV